MKSFYFHRIARNLAMAALCVAFSALGSGVARAQDDSAVDDRMSDMGAMAQKAMQSLSTQQTSTNGFTTNSGGVGIIAPASPQDDDVAHGSGGQAETSVACDSTGQHIVVGFNDTRGFALNPTRVSGFMYSDDGGVTWTDGGQLPSPGSDAIGATLFPQVFGDPEIVYLGGSTFIYASIMVKKFSATGTAQTMCVQISNDFGHTWGNPIEVTPCTNPHGLLSGANARDSADKEFMHRDPDTGRLMMSWSNFTSTAFAPGGVEISTTVSDDGGLTWQPRKIVGARNIDGQSSVPRFAGNGSNNAYVVWRTGSTTLSFGGNESVAVSTDNGNTWGAPINLRAASFFTMDHVLGNDRTNNSPGFDVDRSTGATAGNLYVVYADNDLHDGGDIVFQRSTTAGATWSSPVRVNSRPGNDRAQWFPWVDVDSSTGRVHVFFYDQGIATNGDLTEASHTYSDDGGITWSPTSPIHERPWHAGYGNDTGQPNIGDYNQSISRLGEFMATYAYSANQIPFTDGQPGSASMDWPDVGFARFTAANIALRLGTIGVTDSSGDGLYEPGETLSLQIPLESYANNSPLYTTVNGTLSTSTPNVSIVAGNSGYADVATLGSSNNATNYQIKLLPAFVAGTSVELKLNVTTAQGTTPLLYTLRTGAPVTTIIYQNDFETNVTGWATSHGGGNNTIPWTWPAAGTVFATAPFNTTGRVFFHQNANDGLSGAHTRFERLFSPVWVAPANSDYIQVDFDVATNSEDEPLYNITAYDGFCLRITDQTPGNLLRSVLAEAYAYDFTTGSLGHYPKHLPRNSNTAYLQDMSVWAGYNAGWKHVTMKLPGMAGTTFQLRYEFTQDGSLAGSAAAPVGTSVGVAFDNLVVKSVHLANLNHPPVADAGPDMTNECVGEHNYVNLDGGASSDPDAGEPITYEWFQGATSIGTTAAITVDPPHNQTTTYTLVVTDAHGATDTDTVDVTITDTIPPSVVLNGAATMKIFCGTTFVDPGATATDICDGDLTSSIHVSGTVGLTVGTYVLTYSATDEAHNTGTAVRTVKVIYDWTNVLQPINVEGDSIFKLGSTVPVKFRLLGECANDVIVAHLYITKITNNVLGDEMETVSTSAADSGNTFRRGSDGQYIYNLATKGLTKGTYQLRIDLGDGEIHTVLISLK